MIKLYDYIRLTRTCELWQMDKKTVIAIPIRAFGEFNATPLELLHEKGYELLINKMGQRLEGKNLSEFIREAAGVLAGTEKYTKEVLSNTIKLRVISRVGIGLDSVDMEFAKKKQIKVFNTPEAPSLAVAEHTLALTLSLLKNIITYDRLVRNQDWRALKGYILKNKVVGVIGLGRVGRKVATMFKALGCKVLGFDPYTASSLLGNESRIEMEEDLKGLLIRSDIVTLHIPSSKETYHFISRDEIDQMKQGVFIVNTSRGQVLDETALCDGLRNGKVAGAALDVFEEEPYKGPLLGFENVIFTPHVASNAKEARIEMEMEAVYNLISGLEAG